MFGRARTISTEPLVYDNESLVSLDSFERFDSIEFEEEINIPLTIEILRIISTVKINEDEHILCCICQEYINKEQKFNI